MAKVYDRALHLAPYLALWPDELNDHSIDGRKLVIAKLRAALQQERERAADGHWCYDVNRHLRLIGCYRTECKQLAEMLDEEKAHVWIGGAHLVGVT